MMLFRKKKSNVPEVNYNPDTQKAVLKCSICTGEQVAGFKDITTGKITEVMLIKEENDLKDFMEKYHLSDIEKVY